MDEPNFFKALNEFAASVKGFRQSQTINEVNQRAQEIKASAMSDMEKRQMLSVQADDVFMRLLSQGVDPQTAQAAKVSLMPQTPSTADQAVLLGKLNGDDTLLNVGAEVIREEQMRQYEKMHLQAQLQEESQSRLFAQQAALQDKQLASAEQRALINKQRELKPLDTHQIDKLTSIDTAAASLTKLLQDVDSNSEFLGPVAGRAPGTKILSPQYAAFSQELGQFFDNYRIAVTGAGASVGELKILQQNVPNVTDRPDVIKAKIRRALEIGSRAKSIRLQNLGKAGRDVSAFMNESILPPQTNATSLPVQVNLKSYLTED